MSCKRAWRKQKKVCIFLWFCVAVVVCSRSLCACCFCYCFFLFFLFRCAFLNVWLFYCYYLFLLFFLLVPYYSLFHNQSARIWISQRDAFPHGRRGRKWWRRWWLSGLIRRKHPTGFPPFLSSFPQMTMSFLHMLVASKKWRNCLHTNFFFALCKVVTKYIFFVQRKRDRHSWNSASKPREILGLSYPKKKLKSSKLDKVYREDHKDSPEELWSAKGSELVSDVSLEDVTQKGSESLLLDARIVSPETRKSSNVCSPLCIPALNFCQELRKENDQQTIACAMSEKSDYTPANRRTPFVASGTLQGYQAPLSWIPWASLVLLLAVR